MNSKPADPYAFWMRRVSRGLLLGGITIILVGLVGAVLAQAADLRAGQLVHLQLEYFGVFVGISIFFLSSAKYAISRERIYLPLSLGFLGAAVFDLLHPLMPGGTIPALILGGEFRLQDLNGYLWWMSRISVGVGFLIGGLALRDRVLDDQPARLLVRGLVWTLAEIVLLCLLLILLPLPAYYGPTGVSVGLELLPIVVYAGAIFVLLRPTLVVDSALRWVAVSSLGLGAVGQLFAAFSRTNDDPLFVLAHVVKVSSYLVVLFGLYLEHVNLYAQERHLRQTVQEAEQEAIRRRAELFAVIENTADGIAITDRDGRLLHLNRAAQAILGSPSAHAWVGSRLGERVQPITGDAGNPFLDAIEHALRDVVDVRDLELRIGDPAHPTYLSVGIVPLRDDHKEVHGAVIDFHDVTNLRLAEQRYRELTEGAPDGIIEVSRDGIIQFFNPAAEKIFGYQKDEVLGRDVSLLVPDRLRRHHGDPHAGFFGAEEPQNLGRPLERPARRKDGREITIELTLSSREGPTARGVTAVIRDVQQLQRSRREKDGLVAIAQAVNAAQDIRTLCAQAAPTLRTALRYGTVTIFVKHPTRPLLEVLGLSSDAASQTERPRGVKLEPTDPSLAAKTFLTRAPVVVTGAADPNAVPGPAAPLRDEDLTLVVPILTGNQPIGVLAGITSTTRHIADEELPTLQTIALQLALGISQKLLVHELQDTARSLSVTNRELDSFIYTASHDLAEPLRSMANFSQFLLEDYATKLDPQGQDYLKRIHDGALRMRGLLDALLQVSRIRHKPLPFETVDPKRLLDDVRESLDAMLREKKADLVIHDPLPSIYAQPQRLMEVFSNLVSNGLKFNESKTPRVEISANSRDSIVEFRVADNGIGIPEKYQDRVFGLFTRLHPRGQYPGTGAGLAIVRTIIEQHGGQVRIESKEGKGTTVIFTMPKEPT